MLLLLLLEITVVFFITRIPDNYYRNTIQLHEKKIITQTRATLGENLLENRIKSALGDDRKSTQEENILAL